MIHDPSRLRLRMLIGRCVVGAMALVAILPFPLSHVVVVHAATHLSITRIDASHYPNISFQLHVTNPAGIPPSSLPTSQFSLSDGGTHVAAFRSRLLKEGQKGTDILLLIDNGISTHGATIDANKAAGESFISGLGPKDRVAVTFFDSSTHPRTAFTSDRSTLESALNDLKAHGQSRIYDALCTSLQRLNNPGQRYAVILPTDGADIHSRHTRAQCIALARQRHVPVYTVALGTTPVVHVLQGLASGSGGQMFRAANTAQLKSVFAHLTLIFRHDYQLSYRAPETLHRGQHVTLRVRYSPPGGQSADAVRGYTIPSAPWLHLVKAPATLGTLHDVRRITVPLTVSSEDNAPHRVRVTNSGWPGMTVSPTSLAVPPYSAGQLHTRLILSTHAGFPGGLRGTLALHFQPETGILLDRTLARLPYVVPPSVLQISDVPTDLGNVGDLHDGHAITFTVSSTVFHPTSVRVLVSAHSHGTVSPQVLHIPSARMRSSSSQTVVLQVPDVNRGEHGTARLRFVPLGRGVRLMHANHSIRYYVPTWWESNWKWVVPTILVILIALYIIIALSWESLTKSWDTRRRMALGR